MMDAKTIQNM